METLDTHTNIYTLTKYLLLLLISIFMFFPVFAKMPNDSILSVLNKEINNREYYYQKKEKRIDEIKQHLTYIKDQNIRFEFYSKLFNEYLYYRADSSLFYAMKSKETAQKLKDVKLETISKCNLLQCYISAGLFKESCDIMNSIKTEYIPDDMKATFYKHCMWLYSDMRAFAGNTPFYAEYDSLITVYCDLALQYLEPNTFQYDNLMASRFSSNTDLDKRLELYLKLYSTYEITPHDTAKMTSSIAHIYNAMGDTEHAIYYMAFSAIYDTRHAIRETTAKRELARLLHREGEVMEASKYIRIALEEANAYDARHRKMEINSVLPIIEEQRLQIIEDQKSKLTFSLAGLSVLLFALSLTLFIIYKQIKKLRQAKQSIQGQFNKISVINQKLEDTNNKLEITNQKLEESNEIKDQYIIQSIYNKLEYLDKVDNLLVKLHRKLKARQYDDLYLLHKEFNIKSERENMFTSFDQSFFKLFPNFLEEYNKLFNAEDQTELDEEGNLNPELRIFALIRLGINETDQIARFLNLSVNTIYSYKAKIKSKAIVPKEEFEYRIMQIKKRRNYY